MSQRSSEQEDSSPPPPKQPSAELIRLARRLSTEINQSRHDRRSEASSFLKYIGHLLNKVKQLLRNVLSLVRFASHDDINISFLAQGGYNDVWLVKQNDKRTQTPAFFILRLPTEDSLKPNQIQNEVGWLTYLAKHCPKMPVPKVYAHSDGSDGGDQPLYIAMEYIDALMLCNVWMTYTEQQKEVVARKIAEMIVRMGELRFEKIGGMAPSGISAPTVEGHKLFKGRDTFHRSECYDIGPYDTIKQYVLAQYDKEIYYHTHADDSMLDEDFFENVTPAEFTETLRKQRAEAEAELTKGPRDEPFVLCHNDLSCNNIMVKGTEIAALIDWEFAGSYPLSELDILGFDVLEYDGEAEEEENTVWGRKIGRELVPAIAAERGWLTGDIESLTSGGRKVVQEARTEMFPKDQPGDREVGGDGDGGKDDEET